jgi:hypothetical protein
MGSKEKVDEFGLPYIFPNMKESGEDYILLPYERGDEEKLTKMHIKGWKVNNKTNEIYIPTEGNEWLVLPMRENAVAGIKTRAKHRI